MNEMKSDANDMFERRMEDVIGLITTCAQALRSIIDIDSDLRGSAIISTLEKFVIEELDSIMNTFMVCSKQKSE